MIYHFTTLEELVSPKEKFSFASQRDCVYFVWAINQVCDTATNESYHKS